MDLSGYVLILKETEDNKAKLLGSKVDRADFETGDEIFAINGQQIAEMTRDDLLSYLYQCIVTRTICMNLKPRVKKVVTTSIDSAGSDLGQVHDAFFIGIEDEAKERLERLAASKRITPVDITKLAHQLMRQLHPTAELNDFLDNKVHSGRVGSSCPPDNGNKLIEQADHKLSRRPSSPFNNGHTEVLICKDVTDSNNRLKAVDETNETQNWSRRRSGGGLVRVGSEVGTLEKKRAVEDVTGETLDMMVMMSALDNGPHREMAVDVPDSFIARNKTPPRYPPPSRANRTPGTQQNGSAVSERHAAPPPPPPRSDVIKQQLHQASINNNTIVTISSTEPTKEQLESIKKYQDALRKRKEEEDRVAQQNEFLNRSMRGSKKLRELEHEPPETGIVNDGFSSEQDEDNNRTTIGAVDDAEEESQDPYEPIYRVVGYGELIAALQRVHLQLKKNGIYINGKSDPDVAVIQCLLLNPEFVRVLSVHNKVQQLWPPTTTKKPVTPEAQNLVRDCLENIHNSDLPEASELAKLLSQYEIEGVLWAHDTIAQDVLPQDDEATTEVTVTLPVDDSSMYNTDQHPPNITIINIEKTNEPLGATVRNDGDAVIIGRIVRGGAAEKSGLLHEGDEVLEVNGVEMRGKSINDVCDILSVMTGPLTFMIVPSANRVTYQNINGNRENFIMHMKAHFDYDPEDDGYIPCRELGISFQKGEILHVISQEDANWWQAFREGEEDQTLAGLIPSKSFQHQREALKQTITGEKPDKNKPKKQNTLLCGKKNLKKRKKKSLYQDGGYPIYSSNSDEYEAEEILTYEEVALYYPRANHKRPIVLIGPPNIGRHELRQRLMEDRDRFAAAIPHTSRAKKDGEIDGQDYHFITRVQFESDILSRKFVEHGEYEKAYYGTSLDAIRSVVNYSKICVLNLHPQSLKILRSSDLKPFVVFVAPPSLEKLRQKRLKNGEPYKEEELKEIIEKAREMEDKFGHYFDMIIINNDTERAYHQLLNEINSLEREPQWVPATWVKTAS
ncbi:protein PALS1 isoform X1 [Metopolophium dirhodum]|uniref:protein PALS1 isoform X1 n=2 Tax=Metopolophium dirhodum TaxID=44670 RepID=UPI002990421C|nr:protein PALS1 isoform X1 [Metopolophium dirhodum]